MPHPPTFERASRRRRWPLLAAASVALLLGSVSAVPLHQEAATVSPAAPAPDPVAANGPTLVPTVIDKNFDKTTIPNNRGARTEQDTTIPGVVEYDPVAGTYKIGKATPKRKPMTQKEAQEKALRLAVTVNDPNKVTAKSLVVSSSGDSGPAAQPPDEASACLANAQGRSHGWTQSRWLYCRTEKVTSIFWVGGIPAGAVQLDFEILAQGLEKERKFRIFYRSVPGSLDVLISNPTLNAEARATKFTVDVGCMEPASACRVLQPGVTREFDVWDWEDSWNYSEIESPAGSGSGTNNGSGADDGSGNDDVAYLNWYMNWTAPKDTGSSFNLIKSGRSSDDDTFLVRCDSAQYMNKKAACVNMAVLPNQQLKESYAPYRAVMRHIRDALTAPSTIFPQRIDGRTPYIPGLYTGSGTNGLHRVLGESKTGRKNSAVKTRVCNRTPAPPYAPATLNPRPDRSKKEQCDEFPYASTKEGGANSNNDFSVKVVPGNQNSNHGTETGLYYNSDRIIVGDNFWIFLINDCPGCDVNEYVPASTAPTFDNGQSRIVNTSNFVQGQSGSYNGAGIGLTGSRIYGIRRHGEFFSTNSDGGDVRSLPVNVIQTTSYRPRVIATQGHFVYFTAGAGSGEGEVYGTMRLNVVDGSIENLSDESSFYGAVAGGDLYTVDTSERFIKYRGGAGGTGVELPGRHGGQITGDEDAVWGVDAALVSQQSSNIGDADWYTYDNRIIRTDLVSGETTEYPIALPYAMTLVEGWDHYSGYGLASSGDYLYLAARSQLTGKITVLRWSKATGVLRYVTGGFGTTSTMTSDGNRLYLDSVDGLIAVDPKTTSPLTTLPDGPAFSTVAHTAIAAAAGITGANGIAAEGDVALVATGAQVASVNRRTGVTATLAGRTGSTSGAARMAVQSAAADECIDGITGDTTAFMTTGNGLRVLGSNGQYVFVTDDCGLRRVDLSDGETLTLNQKKFGQASIAGNVLYGVDENGTLYRVDVTNGTSVQISVPKAVRGVAVDNIDAWAISRDGTALYRVNQKSATVTTRPITALPTTSPTPTLSVGDYLYMASAGAAGAPLTSLTRIDKASGALSALDSGYSAITGIAAGGDSLYVADAAGSNTILAVTRTRADAATNLARCGATDLQPGCPYTSSITADSAHPDVNARSLTDGRHGELAYGSAWQGRNGAGSYSFTVDLGKAVTIGEYTTSWLQMKQDYVFLPASVTYSVSADGATFTEAARVNRPAAGDSNTIVAYPATSAPVSGRYVKVTVDGGNAWTMVDEFEARGPQPSALSSPSGLSATPTGSQDITVTWRKVPGASGYQILRDGALVASTASGETTTFNDTQLDPDTTYTYAVVAVDPAGHESSGSKTTSATTGAAPPEGVNFARCGSTDGNTGCSYTSSIAADANYPDAALSSLTDGKQGTLTYGPLWQGRNNVGDYSFVIDLGMAATMNEINSSWLQNKSDSVNLPGSITYRTSADNHTWTQIAQIGRPAVTSADQIKTYKALNLSTTARYVEINVAGGSTWTMTDEIEVRGPRSSVPNTPAGVSATAKGPQKVTVAWNRVQGATGYRIYRDGNLITEIASDQTVTFTDRQLDSDHTYAYTVAALGTNSQESTASGTASATTAAIPPPGINLARCGADEGQPGCEYTSTIMADAAYPDSGRALTDGRHGSLTYGPRWQGRNNAGSYSFVVDLGTNQPINEINSSWIQARNDGVYLPANITYWTSSDGNDWQQLADIDRPAVTTTNQIKTYTALDLNSYARYVRITVDSGTAWTMTDEIEIRG